VPDSGNVVRHRNTAQLRSRLILASVLANAMFYGVSGIAVPLALAGHGITKVGVAAYFAAAAVAAAGINLIVGPWLRRHGSPWWGISVAAAVACTGPLFLLTASPAPIVLATGVAMSGMSLVLPHYIAIANTDPSSSGARTVSTVRTTFVAGYIAGLLILTIMQLARSHGLDINPLTAALFFVAATAALARPAAQRGSPPQPAGSPSTASARSSRTTRTIAAVVAAILLLRAADTLRLVYLPLYAVGSGLSDVTVSAIILASVMAELPILPLLAACVDRYGTRPVMLLISASGVASFAIVAQSSGVISLAASQLLYAAFAAGFQSVAIVYLSEHLQGGLGAGAGMHAALFQIGSLIGITAPLVVPGYSSAMFAIAAGFCAAAGIGVLFASSPTCDHANPEHQRRFVSAPPRTDARRGINAAHSVGAHRQR
jgi:hypothetical protein